VEDSASIENIAEDSPPDKAETEPEPPDSQSNKKEGEDVESSTSQEDESEPRSKSVLPLAIALLCACFIGLGVANHVLRSTSAKLEPLPNSKKLAQLDEAIEHDRSNASLLMQRANLFYYELGEQQNALTDLNKVVQLDPKNPGAYTFRADVCAYLHKYDEAKKDLNTALSLAPNWSGVYAQRSHVDAVLERYDQAVTDAQKAIELDPQNSLAVGFLANGYYGLQQFEEAARLYTRELAMQRPNFHPLTFCGRGMARFNYRDFDGAIEDQNTALKVEPQLAMVHILRGYAEAAKGDISTAEASAKKGVLEEISPGRGHRFAGDLYRFIGDWPRALEEYSMAVSDCPTSGWAHRNRGITYYRAGQLQNALEDLQQAVRLNPASTTFSYLARVEGELGQDENADKDLERAINTSVATSDFYSNRAAIMLRRGEIARALADATKAVAMYQYNADANQLIASIYQSQGDRQKAQLFFDRAKKYGYPGAMPGLGW
jgi:tetratricopeptide (TPR) repeat protein